MKVAETQKRTPTPPAGHSTSWHESPPPGSMPARAHPTSDASDSASARRMGTSRRTAQQGRCQGAPARPRAGRCVDATGAGTAAPV